MKREEEKKEDEREIANLLVLYLKCTHIPLDRTLKYKPPPRGAAVIALDDEAAVLG
jgi:hypothetical protein